MLPSDDDDTLTFTLDVSVADAERLIEASHSGEPVTLRIPLKLSGEIAETLTEIHDAPEDTDMVSLLEIAGLDPARDMAGSDLSGTTWGPHDLSGYNLSGCNLTGCDFSESLVDEMIYTDATIDDVIWPEGYVPYNGPKMRH
jgi:hypothetical protein